MSHEQAVCGKGTKMEKGWVNECCLNGYVYIPFPGRIKGNISTVQGTEEKKVEMSFLNWHPMGSPNRQANSLQKITISWHSYKDKIVYLRLEHWSTAPTDNYTNTSATVVFQKIQLFIIKLKTAGYKNVQGFYFIKYLNAKIKKMENSTWFYIYIYIVYLGGKS